MNTYECEICHGINHVRRFNCQNCGTIPAKYSWTGRPTASFYLSGYTIEVYVAFGAERQVSRRTIKRTARTVPLDYYAEA